MEQPAYLAYDRLFDKAKSHETAVAGYHLGKESRQDYMSFPATVSTYIDAVCSSKYYRISPSRTCGRCSNIHIISTHCLASSAQYGKCGCPNHFSECATLGHPLNPHLETRKWPVQGQVSIQITIHENEPISKPKRSEKYLF